jgi:hypothetical protein
MNRDGLLGWVVVCIGVVTILSGAVQMAWPGVLLGVLGSETTPASKHFFGIVGMFMVLFGGLAIQGVRERSAPALLWAGLQKFGAVGAVGIGVANGVFSSLALPVAGFDFVSGVLVVLLWRRVSAASG